MKQALQGLLMAGEHMRDITLDGTKRITIREGHRNYKRGAVLVGCHILNWACLKYIEEVRHTTLGEVTVEECIADECKNVEELKELLSQFYPTIDYDSEVTVIRFGDIGGEREEYELKLGVCKECGEYYRDSIVHPIAGGDNWCEYFDKCKRNYFDLEEGMEVPQGCPCKDKHVLVKKINK